MDTTPKSGRVTSDTLEPLPQPQTNRSVVSVERQAEAGRSTESQSRSRISYDLKADLILLWQVRSCQNPFVRGSDAMEGTAKELATQEPARYNTFISARILTLAR